MIIAEKKAKELLHEYSLSLYGCIIDFDNIESDDILNEFKDCALIGVEELIQAFKQFSIEMHGSVHIDYGHGYWEEVKEEIIKITVNKDEVIKEMTKELMDEKNRVK